MRLLIVGYGFYSLGNGKSGGTVVAGAVRWAVRNPGEALKVSFLAHNPDSTARISPKLRALELRIELLGLGKRLTLDIVSPSDLGTSAFDIGIVAAPEHTHVSYLRQLSGKIPSLLFVKPFGQSLEDVEAGLELATQGGTDVYIELHKRRDAANKQFVSESARNLGASNWFGFKYGQKSSVPKHDFAKWAEKSNPFQYLGAHYVDLILLSILSSEPDADNLNISGSVYGFPFKDNEKLLAFVSASLMLKVGDRRTYIDATCNWMEPAAMPFPSRQEIEFQSEKAHLFSRQDDRGQRFVTHDGLTEPNPQFHIADDIEFARGYGPESVEAFLDTPRTGQTTDQVSLLEYKPTAKVLDFVNSSLKAPK